MPEKDRKRLNPLERAEALKARVAERRARENARIAAAEARAREYGRKRDTRRNILLGSFVLDLLEERGGPDAEAMEELLGRRIPRFLSRDGDRELLAERLPFLAEDETEKAEPGPALSGVAVTVVVREDRIETGTAVPVKAWIERAGRLKGSYSAAARTWSFGRTGPNAVEERRLMDELLQCFLKDAIRVKKVAGDGR